MKRDNEKLKAKIKDNKGLNDTLKLELSVYEKMQSGEGKKMYLLKCINTTHHKFYCVLKFFLITFTDIIQITFQCLYLHLASKKSLNPNRRLPTTAC